MATERNPDGTVVGYFAPHANKAAPEFISPPGAAAGKKKTVIAPGPRADGMQPLQGDYLIQQDQVQEHE
jgi:hypothetical protein